MDATRTEPSLRNLESTAFAKQDVRLLANLREHIVAAFSKARLLEELRTLVAESHFSRCRFSSNHASNYLPIRSELPRDQKAIVKILDEVLARRDERDLKPEHLRGL